LIVGLMADTHDRLPMVETAVKRLNEEKVEMVLHAGDFIAPFVVSKLKGLDAKLIGVFGNNDGDKELLKKKFAEKGFEIYGNFAEVQLGNLTVALLHGHETEILNALIRAEAYNIIVRGHTHVAETRREGKTLIINPGETCGYLTGKSTIALLDTRALEVEIIEL